MSDLTDNSEQISAGLRKALNTHGHGFHYAVFRRGEELSDSREIMDTCRHGDSGRGGGGDHTR